MKPEEQNIAIAKICGIKTTFFRYQRLGHGGLEWRGRFKTINLAKKG